MMVENHTRRFENMTSKKLFLVDGLGALLSAIMLGVALVKLEHIFGHFIHWPCFLSYRYHYNFGLDLYCYRNIDNTWLSDCRVTSS